MVGVRGEYFELNGGEDVFEPVFRSGVNLQITKATHLRASYGQGYRYPTIAEKYIVTTTGGIYVFPNPVIQPETSWSAEAGIKQGFKVGKFMGYLDFAFFHQEYRNTIEYVYAIWAMDSVGFKFLNTGNTRVKGYEFSIMGNGKISTNLEVNVLLGYTYVLPQTLNANEVFAVDSSEAGGGIAQELTYTSTSTDTTDNLLKYRFRQLFKADAEVKFKKRVSVGGSARYYSFIDNIDKAFYDLDAGILNTGIVKYREKNNKGTMVFDARISYHFLNGFSISVISNNVTNLEYSLRPLKIEAPRTLFLQVTARI
jgi:iron complex outermembrane receptor protein